MMMSLNVIMMVCRLLMTFSAVSFLISLVAWFRSRWKLLVRFRTWRGKGICTVQGEQQDLIEQEEQQELTGGRRGKLVKSWLGE